MMRKARWLALAALLGTLGLVLTFASPAHSQKSNGKAPKDGKETMTQRLARESKLKEEQVTKLLNALGPAMMAELKAGKPVDIPGLGSFRVVRVAEHKDIAAGGRPVTIPAFNTVEFVGSIEVGEAANSKGTVPAETVPAFQYIPLPGQTPGQKMGRTRAPSQRVP
jgi:nucleoid DNA-binding protein